jgi:hypothetical protein
MTSVLLTQATWLLSCSTGTGTGTVLRYDANGNPIDIYTQSPSGGGIVTFDMTTGNYVENFVGNNVGGAFQPNALLYANTMVPTTDELPSGTYQITCANFLSDDDGHTYIGTIGGSVGGLTWQMSVAEAIAGINSGNLSFFTLADGMRATVLVGSMPVDAAGIDQLSVRTLIAGEQSAEIRAASFRIGPADHDGKPNPNNSAAFTSPASCQADSIMD